MDGGGGAAQPDAAMPAARRRYRQRAFVSAVLFVIRIQRIVSQVSNRHVSFRPRRSFRRHSKRRSSSLSSRPGYDELLRHRKSAPVQPIIRTHENSSSDGYSRSESLHDVEGDWLLPSLRGRAGSSGSRRSAASKRSAPGVLFCDTIDSLPPRSPSPVVPAREYADDENRPFADFTRIRKPYTLLMVGGRDEGRRPTLAVNYNAHLAAKGAITRRESARERTSLPPIVGRQPLRRQVTDALLRDESPDGRRMSPGDTDVSASPSFRPQTLKYVRRVAGGAQKTGSDTEQIGRRAAAQLAKVDRKTMQKFRENMRGLLDLFTAVEQDDIGTVRAMLQRAEPVDINTENVDGLTALDVALMLNHNDVALLLIRSGAQENPRLSSTGSRLKLLQAMAESARVKAAELSVATQQQLKDVEKERSYWESRLHMLKKMRANVESATEAEPPRDVSLQVGSATSLIVCFAAAEQSGCVVTRYKVEWCCGPDFALVEGTIMLKDLRRLEVTVPNLDAQLTYYVRVSAGNYKGFSEAVPTQPPCLAPSSWRQVENNADRSNERMLALTHLFHEVTAVRTHADWSKLFSNGEGGMKKKKTSLKNLFSASTKFQRTVRKGVYLVSVLYKDERCVCTVDDALPTIGVDENEPATLAADLTWLMKLSVGWDGLRALGQEAAADSPTLHFRQRLLDAAAQMQAALGVVDIGRLHARTFVDANGTVLVVTVRQVLEYKSVQGLAVKWMPLTKLLRRKSSGNGDGSPSAVDALIAAIVDVMNFYESTYIPLDRGLYLCYLKMHSSINDISIVVPENLPSVLPFVYMRSNAHVSREEWEWLRVLDCDGAADARPTSAQEAFHWSLVSASRILLDDLQVAADSFPNHRLYRLEVVQVHPDVCFILCVPSSDDVCSAPCPSTFASTPERRGCLSLPIPVFEMAHLSTYQPEFIGVYCRLSTFLEHFILILQQLSRKTLSDVDTGAYKQQLDKLTGYQQQLEDIWRSYRWITNVASKARDKQIDCGLPLGVLYAYSVGDASTARSDGADSAPAQSDASDGGEDNSDVGYHSDQSVDRAAAVVKPPIVDAAPHLLTSLAVHSSVENPTYALPPAASSSGAAAIGAHSYVNWPPSVAESCPNTPLHYDNAPSCSKWPSACSWLPNEQTARPHTRKPLVGTLERTYSDPWRTTKATSAASVKRHEYVNCARSRGFSVEDASSGSSASLRPPSRRHVKPLDATVSDTELLRRTAPARPLEDLSIIDQLYANLSVQPSPSAVRPSAHSPLCTPNARPVAPAASPPQAGVIRVYAAYESGLARGASVKLQISARTAAREVVALVVQQLHKAVLQKWPDAPPLADDQLADFCLVAVIGARERCLRDDFAPLQLQNPWSRGRLFVRRRDDLLAALDFGNEAKV